MADIIADIRERLAPLLAEAEGALDRREKQYPVLVEAGRMDGQAASDEIRVWRAIVADWRCFVTGAGAEDHSASAEAKAAVLAESFSRYTPALARAIANERDDVRRDCAEIKDRGYLRDLYGNAVAAYLDLLDSADRILDLHSVYAGALPSNRPWRGIWQSVEDYLDFHRRARTEGQVQRAA